MKEEIVKLLSASRQNKSLTLEATADSNLRLENMALKAEVEELRARIKATSDAGSDQQDPKSISIDRSEPDTFTFKIQC